MRLKHRLIAEQNLEKLELRHVAAEHHEAHGERR
jgi:hypothetical protein